MTARFGSFELDPARRLLFRDGREIHLTPKAFHLLSVLIDAAPAVVPKATLHERLWPNGVVSDSALVALIQEIRRALDDRDRDAPLIRTAHRIGYALDRGVERTRTTSSEARWVVVGAHRIALADGENIIGRDPESAVQLDHATVSRRHARLVVTPEATVLEDLGSKNGTTVHGAKLDAPVTLRNGDRFACGHLLISYKESGTGPATVTQASRVDAGPKR